MPLVKHRSHKLDKWPPQRVMNLFDEVVREMRARFTDGPVTEEVVGFINGYLAAKGFPPIDVTDAVLAHLTARESFNAAQR